MKNATKGALLSGLVFPGLGQYVLGEKKLGLGLISLTAAALAVVGIELTRMVTTVLHTIGPALEKGGDPASLAQAAVRSMGGGSWAYQVAAWVIPVCWVVGLVHAWRLGQKRDGRKTP